MEQDDNNTENNIPDEADGEDRDLPAHPSSARGGRELAVYVVLHRSGEHDIKAKILKDPKFKSWSGLAGQSENNY